VTGLPVGATIGVEEEYHLVDAQTMALTDAPQVTDRAIELLGECAQGEISTAQVEIATPVVTTLAEVRREVARLRLGADQAAQESGCRILVAGTHPFSTWRDQSLRSGVRYVSLLERWGVLALQQMIAGCHVHVSVPSPEVAVHVLDRIRPDLPALLALSGSSPFWEGTDTAYASYRTQWFARWPVTGATEVFGSYERYQQVVADLVTAGMVDDASHLYWDARPSTRWPTVEVRVADVMPVLDDVVLHAALARSLVRVAAASDAPVPEARPEAVRAARWRAARHGLEDRLLDLRAHALVPAEQLVRDLLDRLRDDLEDAGEWDEVWELADQALTRGTSAARQRWVMERTGDLEEVTRSVVLDTFGDG
jgi:YbdK family carboxylate-amine ligase